MKIIKLIILIITFFFHINILAQITMLKGKILNFSDSKVELSSFWDSHSSTIKPDGTFEIGFKTQYSRYYAFKNGNTKLKIYIHKNDTVQLFYDAQNLSETLLFSGNHSELNTQLFLISGKEAADFTFKDKNGNPVSLSDFKGKYVYLDLWFTTCSPCRKEFPYYEKIRKKYVDKNIVFIAISLDIKEDVWKQYIKENKLGGIHLYGNGWDTQFIKNYLIMDVPRYILIDKDHRILDIYAPKPSGKLEETLKGLAGL